MLHNGLLLKNVEEYVTTLLSQNLSSNLTFHNLSHTENVVSAVIEIAAHCLLPPDKFEMVVIAAWFHDCGYTTTYINHEDSSKAIASKYLQSISYPADKINEISDCIEATRYPQKPKTTEAEILCDADLYHLAKPDYNNYQQALRQERYLFFDEKDTDVAWVNKNCTMLSSHIYFTEYGKDVLQKFKEINLERLRCKM